MIRDLIERFRYRFELWRRERREDLFGTPRSQPPEERDYTSYYSDPKRAVLVTESTVRSIGRFVWVYFGVIIIMAQICVVIDRWMPSARFAVGVTFLVLVSVWTLGAISVHIDIYKARKAYRQNATKSSNHAAGDSESVRSR
jgi:hypothetical protein